MWSNQMNGKLKSQLMQNFQNQIPCHMRKKKNSQLKPKINVPFCGKSQYEDQHYDVFSKGKTDMGKANNFEHKIELKEDNPIY